MKCPHCLTDFHDDEKKAYIGNDQDGDCGFGRCRCSACGRLIIRLFSAEQFYEATTAWGTEISSRLIRPKVSGRTPVPTEVPGEYSADYGEACLVLADSAKASAALSRR